MLVMIVASIIFLVPTFWLVGWIGSDLTAKGTQARFIFRSIQAAAQWPCLVYYCVRAPLMFGNGEYFKGALAAVCLLIVVNTIKEFYESDDDDIFKRGKKKAIKLFRAAKRKARVMMPARPVPAYGGA